MNTREFTEDQIEELRSDNGIMADTITAYGSEIRRLEQVNEDAQQRADFLADQLGRINDHIYDINAILREQP